MFDKEMVFGVDNEGQIECKDRLATKKNHYNEMLKEKANSESFGTDRELKAKILLGRSDRVIIYGLSLGETDLRWKQRLKTWIETKATNIIMVYRLEKFPQRDISNADYLDEYDLEKKSFLIKIGFVDTEVDLYMSQVIVFDDNIFDEIKDIAKRRFLEA